RQFLDRDASGFAAASAAALLSPAMGDARADLAQHPIEDLLTADLIFLASLALLVPNRAAVDITAAEEEIVRRVLVDAAPVRDVAEAAGLYVILRRAIDRFGMPSAADADPVSKVVALCRRFQLFVDRLQTRQRSRAPYDVDDEYDVQDLLHAILKLHFDDVRPEEWTPSYAGNASRIDFLLPRERTIIEAKMTRPNLGQKEVANELIVDVARYAKFPHVDTNPVVKYSDYAA
ncbi:MAG: hypothetical protein HC871_06855, partial [Rhizobiales bacterium]|nr:hypothetical protein [Hyphomicrobiales bacterium]